MTKGQGDGVSDPSAGGSESGGGAWKGENDKPSSPDEGVVTHNPTERKKVKDGGPPAA